ncbi:Protein of unknown function (DUF3738) [Terriglobus roseus DSM 18391]|uniref:Soil-associated protein, TIGR03435 family n=1 Tax=Terriglobus roseus (strain DSM 18391 / NRRL B-41598 / KBS 63) TaxID=926566 RepID=I3ZJ30_TERRK|nr:TIGR03435 family protein [Terriglobus roseus]AFL89248.1 Protein of unknown function (DUF3738) [Terriglobus roseus DSM 18391]
MTASVVMNRRARYYAYLHASVLLFFVLPPQAWVFAQRPPSPVAQPIRFDVVSVKENKSGDKPSANVPLDRSDTFAPTRGKFTAINQPLVAYIIFAYKMKVTESYGGLMEKLPSWAKDNRFDILAQSDKLEASKDDLRGMVRLVLEDRFQLKAHREQAQTNVYGLYVSEHHKKSITQLQQHVSLQEPCARPPFMPPAATPVRDLVSRWPGRCGDGGQTQRSRYLSLTGGRNMTMPAIADWLTGAADLDRPILDKTGLSGTYDFVLEFTPEYLEEVRPIAGSEEVPGPSFVSALNDQLGLRLKKETGTATLFVVDHVEYPSEN